jgi:ankyrin repeat protein
MVKMFIEGGASVDVKPDSSGWAALDIVCRDGHEYMVKQLIGNRAHIDSNDDASTGL